jgi:hypothetical protein
MEWVIYARSTFEDMLAMSRDSLSDCEIIFVVCTWSLIIANLVVWLAVGGLVISAFRNPGNMGTGHEYVMNVTETSNFCVDHFCPHTALNISSPNSYLGLQLRQFLTDLFKNATKQNEVFLNG